MSPDYIEAKALLHKLGFPRPTVDQIRWVREAMQRVVRLSEKERER